MVFIERLYCTLYLTLLTTESFTIVSIGIFLVYWGKDHESQQMRKSTLPQQTKWISLIVKLKSGAPGIQDLWFHIKDALTPLSVAPSHLGSQWEFQLTQQGVLLLQTHPHTVCKHRPRNMLFYPKLHTKQGKTPTTAATNIRLHYGLFTETKSQYPLVVDRKSVNRL